MLHLRRHDLSPRVELLPLIDVVFLLLTFFIYSLIVMRYLPQVMPVRLTPVTAGQAVERVDVQVVTIDRAGRLFLNREPLPPEAVDARLGELAATQPPVKLFIAMEELDAAATGSAAIAAPQSLPGVDRGPILIDLMGKVRKAGIEDFSLVGDERR